MKKHTLFVIISLTLSLLCGESQLDSFIKAWGDDYSKQEIDFIEEKDGVFSAFEFKYSSKKSGAKCPLTFSNNYPEIPFSVITKENYIEFITEN